MAQYLLEYCDNGAPFFDSFKECFFEINSNQTGSQDQDAIACVGELLGVEELITPQNCSQFGIVNLFRLERKLVKVL